MVQKQIPEYTRGLLAKWQIIRNRLNEGNVSSGFVTARIVALSDELKRQGMGHCENALAVFMEELSIVAQIDSISDNPAVLTVVREEMTRPLTQRQYEQLKVYVADLSKTGSAA